MKKFFLLLALLLLALILFLAGCALPDRDRSTSAEQQTVPAEAERFKVLFEQGETKNLGGFTVIRDSQTGKEYLVVVGLNGAPTVVNLQ